MKRIVQPKLRSAVALVAMLVGLLGMAIPAAANTPPTNCTVTNVDGGIQVDWDLTHGAGPYVYRLEVEGQPNRYKRVPSNATTITLDEGVIGTVFVSGVQADGSYTPSANCGSGSANEGSGGSDQEATCSITDADGGIKLEWSAIDEAEQYVFRVDIDGRAPRYKRVDDTTAFIPLNEGLVAKVRVSAVFANGSYSPSTDCGSGQANDGTGPVDPTCSVEGVPDGIKAAWTAVPGAVQYVYRLKVEGQPNRYNRVDDTTTVIKLPAGTTGNVAVSAVLASGRYVRAVDCGEATPSGDNIEVGSCRVVGVPGGVEVRWNPSIVVDTYSLWIGESYESTASNDSRFFARVTASQLETFYPAPAGSSVLVERISADRCNRSATVPAASVNATGECTATFDGDRVVLTWHAADGADRYEVRTRITRTRNGVKTEVPETTYGYQPSIPGSSVFVVAIGADGTYSAATSCGKPDPGSVDPVFPAGPAECSMFGTLDGQVLTDWSEVDFGDLGPNDTAYYELLVQIDNGGARFSELIEAPTSNFNTPPRDVIPIETPYVMFTGDTFSASVRPVIRDATNATNDREGRSTDCGSVELAGNQERTDAQLDATCSMNGRTVTWTSQSQVTQYIAIQGFRTPLLILFVDDAPGTYEVLTDASQAAANVVTMFGVNANNQITTSVNCGSFGFDNN